MFGDRHVYPRLLACCMSMISGTIFPPKKPFPSRFKAWMKVDIFFFGRQRVCGSGGGERFGHYYDMYNHIFINGKGKQP